MSTKHRLPACIQHIGHEGHWVGTSWCIHDVDDHCGKWGCLEHRISKVLIRGLITCSHALPPFLPRENECWPGVQSLASPSHTQPQAANRGWANSPDALMNKTQNTHQGLSDDCPRSWPGEYFNLSGCVNQDIPGSRRPLKGVILGNSEDFPSQRKLIVCRSKTAITSAHCQTVLSCPKVTYSQSSLQVQDSCYWEETAQPSCCKESEKTVMITGTLHYQGDKRKTRMTLSGEPSCFLRTRMRNGGRVKCTLINIPLETGKLGDGV